MMMKDFRYILYIVLVCVCVSEAAYKNCPHGDKDRLNVHLVAHTHDDVGWLKTVDQYYYGARNNIQNAGVQYILDSVIQELLQDPHKRFVYVETAFFWRWWNEQHDHLRHLVKALVRKGQLEFIGGGWSMEDEACTHYSAIIENMSWGLRRINDTFGPDARPVVAWQIDPFGHSREQASLFAQMGYDGLFFGRLDFADKGKREATKNMEFVWQASANLGNSSWLFTGVLPNGYSPPAGFNFDILSNDAPFMDDKKLDDYNVVTKIETFLHLAHQQAKKYATNHIIMTMGNDFNYQNAHVWYKNLDKLIKYMKKTSVNVFYSTPSCYLKALHNAGRTWKTKEDDFFPYASDPHAYWTGYFSSRPALKSYIRKTNLVLQTCGQLSALSSRQHEPVGGLVHLRETLGVLQHHDAVTGTSKQEVAADYAKRAYKAIDLCQPLISESLNFFMKKNMSTHELLWESCNLLNISQCSFTETQSTFLISVYNPLARGRDTVVQIPVKDGEYAVWDYKGVKVKTALYPLSESVIHIPGRMSTATHELVFIAADVPALGYNVYYVQQHSGYSNLKRVPLNRNTVIGRKTRLSIDGATGLISSLTSGSVNIPLNQTFGYYLGMKGHNQNTQDRASGAYIFRPNGTAPVLIHKARKVTLLKGPFFDEIEQTFNDWISQIIRVGPDDDFVELNWIVGPIPVKDGVGKEVILNVQTNLISGRYFWTDSNGREKLLRVRNFRPTWHLNITEPVSGNYYPINSHLTIKDYSKKQLSIMVDRAQGGSSRKKGQMELMIHRRLLYDDAFGVGEALNETAFGKGLVVKGEHRLVVSDGDVLQRMQDKDVFYRPILNFAKTTMTPKEWSESYINRFSGIRKSVPLNVHLLTLTPWRGNQLLLRLEHFFEKDEHPVLSQPVKVFLKDIFSPWSITSVEETNLAANQFTRDASRLQWKVAEDADPSASKRIIGSDLVIVLYPMQIRTFLITINSH